MVVVNHCVCIFSFCIVYNSIIGCVGVVAVVVYVYVDDVVVGGCVRIIVGRVFSVVICVDCVCIC